jgi:hypothetical protein
MVSGLDLFTNPGVSRSSFAAFDMAAMVEWLVSWLT